MPPSARRLMRSFGVIAIPGYFISDTPWAGVKASVGTWGRLQNSTYLSGGIWANTTPAINDEHTRDHYLSGGTYKIAWLHRKNTDHGICTFQFSGVSQGTIDHYAASASENNYAEITSLAVTAGVKTIKQIAASKNASATDYNIAGYTAAYVRTGA